MDRDTLGGPDPGGREDELGGPAATGAEDTLGGADPERRDYASVADFADPDGNTWVIQEIGYRPDR